MSLLEDIRFSNSMNNLQELLNGYFIDLERAIDRYIFRIANDSVGNSGDTEQQIEVQNRQKQMLENIIQLINKIQLIFEELDYTNNTSVSVDVDEDSFIDQLKQYKVQMFRLTENFNREYFTAFATQTYYLAALAEFHYNAKFGSLSEEVEMTSEDQEITEEANDYLDSLPEQDASDLH